MSSIARRNGSPDLRFARARPGVGHDRMVDHDPNFSTWNQPEVHLLLLLMQLHSLSHQSLKRTELIDYTIISTLMIDGLYGILNI